MIIYKILVCLFLAVPVFNLTYAQDDVEKIINAGAVLGKHFTLFCLHINCH